MKAFTKKFLSLAISALTLTNTASISAYADVTRGLSEEEILNSSVKPVMTVTKELLQPDSGVSSKKMNTADLLPKETATVKLSLKKAMQPKT